ncbi:FCD domain-containing protein [Microbacterium sp. QXD-8]|uniref:FCD domain-containing protein n=1 Tax=Microbacterium psychrotolerans TaxID=3068321 RepID=A0ABU0YW29_9MICO|nr:FCD domain-containing protein [Microbacterium sp. QXD-8]MDQ7876531.1 FCD domain-containing protein [Microbacterium sp. QXD-8]
MSNRPRPAAEHPGYALRGRQGVIIEALGRAIVAGRYAEGDVLPREDDLCAEFGMSRTTVRGAMTVLAAKGLIEIRPKTGTKVRPRALWNVFDSDLLGWAHLEGEAGGMMDALIELRQIMEPAAARLAATRATIRELGPLSRAASALAVSIGDPVAYPEWDVAFHLAVYDASHNPLLARFGLLVADFMKIAFEIQQHGDQHEVDLADDAARHLAVSDAIARGDADAAAAAMLEVVLDGKNALAAAMSDADPRA